MPADSSSAVAKPGSPEFRFLFSDPKNPPSIRNSYVSSCHNSSPSNSFWIEPESSR
jgi:hypothetical protein